jgi:hypothetical protein
MADSDLDLGAADSASGPLAHRNRDAVTMHVKLLRLDRELVEDLELHLERSLDLLDSAVGVAKQTVLRLEPFELVVEKCESRL